MVVEVFSQGGCAYCKATRDLLDSYEVLYEDLDLRDPYHNAMLDERLPHATTVPQIFIDGEYIGGYKELITIHKSGELERKLGSSFATEEKIQFANISWEL